MSVDASGIPESEFSGAAVRRYRKISNWNIPNVLTSIRIVAIPLFIWLAIKGGTRDNSTSWWALGLFVLLMATDKFDGDIARSHGMVTDFGKIADPIADKALMAAALISLNVVGVVAWWITIVILVREFGITVWRFFQLRSGNVVPASKGGKLKTSLQALAVTLYLCPLPSWADLPSLIIMYLAVAVTVVTGVQYVLDSRKTDTTNG